NEMQIKNSRIMNNTESVTVRIFNTYSDGEWYHPFRSVNCLFAYNLLHDRPITVYSGHTRTSTYVYDCVNALKSIADNFKPGETYNIASKTNHTIEYLADLILQETGANPGLVKRVDENEILTTKDKFVDASKAERDLKITESYSLEEGVKRTIEWMRRYYNLD
ncbi:MAG TPA: nucleoside-diphosphate sugar epimerase, partial [Flavobacteriaceae bacterium]|nr:nucleoside-diphosphate sugar epimerase [Flavobacteriaceae bacterium]